EGGYERHLRRVVREVGERLAATARVLNAELPSGSHFMRPEGGYLFWVTLPEGIDSYALLPIAKQAGVVYAPGQIFFPDEQRSAALRLSVANVGGAEIERGVRRLAAVAGAALPRGAQRRAGRTAAAVQV